ncbi:MAG: hypothetical protein KC425_11115 [Anaerolineales bacterium]|nr:hypothetical protein [Anaerolineales bacterium]
MQQGHDTPFTGEQLPGFISRVGSHVVITLNVRQRGLQLNLARGFQIDFLLQRFFAHAHKAPGLGPPIQIKRDEQGGDDRQ